MILKIFHPSNWERLFVSKRLVRLQQGLSSPVFGRKVNPISTRGADYIHNGTTSPLPWIFWPWDGPVIILWTWGLRNTFECNKRLQQLKISNKYLHPQYLANTFFGGYDCCWSLMFRNSLQKKYTGKAWAIEERGMPTIFCMNTKENRSKKRQSITYCSILHNEGLLNLH